VWVVWAVTTIAVLVTYSRIDPKQTYNVSRSGIEGGLSRALVHLNWPMALAAIALVLVAMGALPRRAWWLGGASMALCATIPFFVDQGDLDARWVNAIPALGVVTAFGLTVAATLRAGASFQPRLPGDPVRLVLAVVVLVLSLPYITAEWGFHFPGDVFMGEELFRQRDGHLEAAVHLGEHHGFHGALLLLTALTLSRVRPPGRRLQGWLLAATAALACYGAINFVQDMWHEQLVKRGWIDWKIPSAILPSFSPVWLATLALAGLGWWLLARERAILEE
jgi:hypothetical protein